MGASQELETIMARVPVWGWAALGGGAFLLVMSRHSKVAHAIVDPNAGAVPDPNAGGPQPIGGPIGMSGPISTPDPGASGTSETLSTLLGGNLGAFVAGLRNAPSSVSATEGGSSISYTDPTAALAEETTLANIAANNNVATTWLLGQNAAALQYELNQGNIAELWQQGQNQWGLAWLQGQTDLQKRWLAAHGGGNPNPQAPAIVCSSGDTACIAAHCAHGDLSCAQAVAPWWGGSPIAGWS